MLYHVLFHLDSLNENKTFYLWNFSRVQSKGKKKHKIAIWSCLEVLLRKSFSKLCTVLSQRVK